jgi:hypothetical protein
MWLELAQLLGFALGNGEFFGGYIYSEASATNPNLLYVVNDFINQKSSLHYYGGGEFHKIKEEDGGLVTVPVYMSEITHEKVVEAYLAFKEGRTVIVRDIDGLYRGSTVINAANLKINGVNTYILSYLNVSASLFDTPTITSLMSQEGGTIKRGDLTDEEPLTSNHVQFINISEGEYNYYSWDASSLDNGGYGFTTNEYSGNIAFVEMLVDGKIKGMKNYKINGRFISSLDYVYVKAGDTIEVASARGSITIYGLDDGETVP